MTEIPASLARCPNSPNCVSSVDDDESHRVEPLTFVGDADAAYAALRAVIDELPRTQVVTDSGSYMHVTFTTRLMRYKDDVEFLLDRDAHQIDVRSASRVGYSDLGANRKRVERIRVAFQAANR